LIEFLKWLAIELSKIVENIERAIAQPGSEPMFLGMAGTIAYDLKLGLLAAVEKNRVKIWEGGAVVGAACLLAWLTGETPAEILRILWGKNK
jgi:hypothetical protein